MGRVDRFSSAVEFQTLSMGNRKGVGTVELNAIILMVIILGFIWGGLAYLVNRAFKREREEIS
ncbi:MAG: MetS family NSS transporter small subunit [Calditrichaeota bacterium]|nr:MAG: MetS family NSS transporter small subunit [Calditrichota bacterium]